MPLRYAYNTNGCANHRLGDALALIAEAGYDGVALTLDHHHFDPFAPDFDRRAGTLDARLRALGLGLVVETGARFLLNPRQKHEPTLLHPDPDARERRLDFLTRALDVCEICGGEAVSFWSGTPQEGVAEDDAWQRLTGGVATVVERAEERGVTAAFEPEPGHLTETVASYERLADEVPGLRLALDTGHCLVTQDVAPAEAVRSRADRLGTVAIEDMRRGVHRHLPFGEGDMDVPAVLQALRETGFDRLVCVELSRASPTAHETIPQSLAFLKDAERKLVNGES
jgi:sugar phosphate isomerase/epimerase